MWLYSKQILSPAKLALFDHLVFQRFMGLCLRSDVHPEVLVADFWHQHRVVTYRICRHAARSGSRKIVRSRCWDSRGAEYGRQRKETCGGRSHSFSGATISAGRASRGFAVIRCDGGEPVSTNAMEIMDHIRDELRLIT